MDLRDRPVGVFDSGLGGLTVVRELTAEIDLETADPCAYGYTDQEGNRVRFELRDWHPLAAIPETLFVFHVPPGYELLEVD